MNQIKLERIIKRFLKYSFEDADYKWINLTDAEQKLCSPAEFKSLVNWIKKSLERTK